MNEPEPGAAAPFTLKRRTLPGSLRYLAGGTDPVHVALTLGVLAAELDGQEGKNIVTTSQPHRAAAGDRIEHELMPGFVMTVQDVRRCENDSGRPELHDAYKVTDPDGSEDWLCAYDVRVAP